VSGIPNGKTLNLILEGESLGMTEVHSNIMETCRKIKELDKYKDSGYPEDVAAYDAATLELVEVNKTKADLEDKIASLSSKIDATKSQVSNQIDTLNAEVVTLANSIK
jgi:peptidoglycan hydrolase CwlO-like protein